MLGLTLIFFWPVTLGGRVLLPLDNLLDFAPWKQDARLLAPGYTHPYNPLISDLVLQNIGWKGFIRQSFAQGQFPLWNPYLFSGVPFQAQAQYGTFYPLGVLFYVLPLPFAYGYFAALHFFLAGAFMYGLMRLLLRDRIPALVSAITFQFCAFLVVTILWPQMTSTAVWLPLIVAMCELIIRMGERVPAPSGQVEPAVPPRHRTALWVALGALAVGMQFLAGHSEISFYVMASAGIYSLFRLLIAGWKRRSLRPLLLPALLLLGMVALGSALSAIQMVPFAELIGQNYRAQGEGAVTYQQVVSWALPYKQVATFLMPDFFGNQTVHRYFDIVTQQWTPVTHNYAEKPVSFIHEWGPKNYVEQSGYTGILPLLLALIALVRARSKYMIVFAGLTVIALLFAFGTPAYLLIWNFVPGFNQLHSPFRWVFTFDFAVAALAGFGMQSLLRSVSSGSKASFNVVKTIGGGALLLSLGCWIALALVLVKPQRFIALAQAAIERSYRLYGLSDNSLPGAFASGQMLLSYEWRNAAWFALFLLGSALVALAADLLRKRSGAKLPLTPAWHTGLVVFGLVVLVGDLLHFGMPFNTTMPPVIVDYVPPAVRYLQADHEVYRIQTFGDDKAFNADVGLRFGIQDVRGYDTVIPKHYVQYQRLMEDQSGALLNSRIAEILSAHATVLDSPLLHLENVKYILTTYAISNPHYTLVFPVHRPGFGEMRIYRNERYLPRAFLVNNALVMKSDADTLATLRSSRFDPARIVLLTAEPGMPAPVIQPASTAVNSAQQAPTALITRYTPNRVEITASPVANSYLVLSDEYFAGWQATVDGKAAPIYRADNTFRAVVLSPGTHKVIFAYKPFSFLAGAFVSLLAAIALLFILVIGLWSAGSRPLRLGEEDDGAVRRVLKNTASPIGAQALSMVLTFGFWVIATRILGPTHIGQYGFAVVIYGYFGTLTNFGLGTLLTRHVSQHPDDIERYTATIMTLRLGLSLLTFPLTAAVVASWRLGPEVALTLYLLDFSLLPDAVAGTCSAVFWAYQQLEYVAMLTILSTIVSVTTGLVVLLVGAGITGLAATSILTNMITMIAFLVLVRRYFRPRLAFDPRLGRELLVASFPLLINNLLNSIFFRIDVVILQPLRGDRDVGFYNTAYKFNNALGFIPSFFTLALFPLMAKYAANSRESLQRAYLLSLKLLLIIAIPTATTISLLAAQIIALIFGSEFAPSAAALSILIWFLPFSYINGITQYVLIALDKQRWLTGAFLGVSLFNIAANLLLIPRSGILGASLVTVLSEIVLLVPWMVCIRHALAPTPLLGLCWRPALASLFVGLAVWWLRGHLPLLATLLLAVPLYLGLLLALHPFTSEELAVAKRVLGNKLGREAREGVAI